MQPIKTPLARALGMSPARLQPCVGYLAGGSGLADPYSLTGIAAQLYAQGTRPGDPNKPDLTRAFNAMPGLQADSFDHCPGFPEGYPAALTYAGSAKSAIKTEHPDHLGWRAWHEPEVA